MLRTWSPPLSIPVRASSSVWARRVTYGENRTLTLYRQLTQLRALLIANSKIKLQEDCWRPGVCTTRHSRSEFSED